VTKDKPRIPENHRRSLSVTARTIEKSLDEMEELLSRGDVHKLTYTVHSSYTDDERQSILEIIRELRKANEEMVNDLGLRSEERKEVQIIQARVAHLWTILVDSTSRGMKGFGVLSKDHAREVDQHVEKLLNLIQQLM
jgi:hypothetical protein